MKLARIPLVLLETVVISHLICGDSFSLDCNNLFTSGETSFCVGIPVQCAISLDPELCNDEENLLSDNDLDIALVDSFSGNFFPSFTSRQSNLTVYVNVDYVPMVALARININIEAKNSSNCTFEVTHESTVRDEPSKCLYPVSLYLTEVKPDIRQLSREMM